MQFVILLIVIIVAFIALYIKASNLEKSSSDPKPLELLASFLSDKNEGVVENVRFYLNSPKAYFEKHTDNLSQRGIERAEEVTSAFVLIDALLPLDKIVYQDHKADPSEVLEMLNNLSQGKLKEGEGYAALSEHYKQSKFGIGEFLETDSSAPSIFECISSTGLKLLAINEDSDSYALVLIDGNELERFIQVATEADIRINFNDK
ncbi:MAG: hypothetical protein V7785_18640 [Bermanella sp.]